MTNQKKPKIILVPYPAQGHVTPMLKLASFLGNRNFEPVVITPDFIHRSISSTSGTNPQISYMGIPDGLVEGSPRDFFATEKAMENDMPVHLERIVEKFMNEEGGGGILCFVVDLLASWAMKVGWQCGIPVAGFWPAMEETYNLIAAIPHMIRAGIISDTGIPQYQGPILLRSLEPSLCSEDLPWLIGTSAERKARFKFWTRTLERSKVLQWLLVNSFPNNLHDENHNVCKEYPQIFSIGFINDAKFQNPSFWEEDVSCLDWLDKQKESSVLYISFGSWVSPIGDTKVKSLALALEALGQPFIWVLGFNWRNGLPSDYMKKVSEFGRVVSWAPQVKVLQHKAVRCYLTHCGWNSTVEAIQCRKPLLCYPIAGDQFLNCKYIVEIWQIGVRLNGLGYTNLENRMKNISDDKNINARLVKVKERMMGKEARFEMEANIATFTDLILEQGKNKLACEIV